MAQGSIKIAQISKDFTLKSKDVIDIFAKELSIDKKSGASADAEEFELFLKKLTLSRQIKDLESYLDGTNKLTVENGAAYMSYSECPDHTCENTGKIKYVGQTIVCLPNYLTVTVVGESDNSVDFVS